MPIHRDLEQLQEQMSDLQNTFVLFVLGRIPEDQMDLAMEWVAAFMAGDQEQAEELLGRLLNIPVPSMSHEPQK